MRYRPLSAAEVKSVIAGKGAASRVPVLLHFWVHPEAFGERERRVLALLEQYPEDAQTIYLPMPDLYKAPPDAPDFRWLNRDLPPQAQSAALDARVGLPDWGELPEILEHFPRADYPGLLPYNPAPDGRYRLGYWWFCFFERHWSLRGMTNALMDFYTAPEAVHSLYSALCDFYEGVITRAASELHLDGVFTSDDLGTQTGGFFSPAIFREFFEPYYRRLIQRAHSLGLQFWLHMCGDVSEFLPYLVDLGLDVVHPIQKYAMDEVQIARTFGGRITFWAGFDVQQVIPFGTPDEVRAEVRHLVDTYWRPEGRFMLTAGNGVNGDCPLSSLEALFEESFAYGEAIARRSR